jgi:hypothetical protein
MWNQTRKYESRTTAMKCAMRKIRVRGRIKSREGGK